ncbi:MAG: hypothetical protein PUG74_05040 [Prevotellaceae bacterium]|nr:hypothetical protein [Prevotellaceae bacterium]
MKSISNMGNAGLGRRMAPARSGWEEAARKMSTNRDDELLIPDVFEEDGFEEW